MAKHRGSGTRVPQDLAERMAAAVSLTSAQAAMNRLPNYVANGGLDMYRQAPGGLQQRQRAGAPIMGVMPPDPDDQARPSMMEYGAPGVAIIGGVIQGEEYNPDLQWQAGLRVYDKMRRSEPMIRQSLWICKYPLLGATYKVAPASPDPRHIEQASYIESSLFHDLQGQTFRSIIEQAFLMFDFGFMLFEKVFYLDDLGNVKWQKFAPRLPKTIHRWWEGPDKDLVGVQQWAWNPATQSFDYFNIPAGSLLHLAHQQEGNNYEGISLLRTSYKPWWFKQSYEKLQAVGFEREHVGIPVISLPQGYSDSDRMRARQIGRNARSNEVGYIVLPPDWGVEWLKSKSPDKKGASIQDAIRYCDLQMQNNVLAGFLSLGQSGTGSYAASTDQSAIFLKSLQHHAMQVTEAFSMDAFPQLIRFNFGAQDMYPSLVAQNIQAYNLKDISRALHELVLAGAMRPTVELEDYIYQYLGIPRPPANLIESTSDGKGGEGRLKPDATGLTPLPLTPEEEIAVGNRMTRDIQRISTLKPSQVGTTSDKGSIPALLSKQAGGKPASGGDVGDAGALNDIYSRYLTENRFERPMTYLQAGIYKRMAQEAGRPVIQLRGDYVFASATPEPAQLGEFSPHQQRRLDRRQAAARDFGDEIRGHMDTLRQDLLAAVREEVSSQIDDLGDAA